LSRNVKENSKSFYNYVRSKQKERKERVGPLKKEYEDGEVILDDVKKVCNFCWTGIPMVYEDKTMMIHHSPSYAKARKRWSLTLYIISF